MTPNESMFMRELRQLLRRHSVKLSKKDAGGGRYIGMGQYEDNPEYLFEGPCIVLDIYHVQKELKHPEE